jgi:hypothetical protein
MQCNDPQLIRRQHSTVRRRARSQWKKITLATGLGILFGFSAAALGARGDAAVTAAPARTDYAEVTRLKIRNRRLEALITVLRERRQQRLNQE